LTRAAESTVIALTVDGGSIVGAEVTLGAFNFNLAHGRAVSTLIACKLNSGTFLAEVTRVARSESLCTFLAEEASWALPALILRCGTGSVSVGAGRAWNRVVSHTDTWAVVTSWAHVANPVIDTLLVASGTSWA
jgi:hypothetical protein